MGLSKKLGQTTGQHSNSPRFEAVAYQWSHQSYTIQDILRKFKLPCVVQCVTDSCNLLWSDFQFDLRQPLLLYGLRTVRKIHARSLDRSTLEEFGPPVAIPEDYEGWFALSPKGINTVKRHTRIQGVFDANTPSFLVCTKCPAFTSVKGLASSSDFIPHEVMAGEILKRICVMDNDSMDSSPQSFLHKYGPCLECLDEKGEDIVIPFSHRVMTYEVAESFPCDEHKVFNTKAIVTAGNMHLPRVLTVVHGNPPTLPYSYTGLYRCYSVFTEETVLAATLDETRSMCLELATDSCAKFSIGLNDAVIKKTCEYNNAYQACRSAGEKYWTGIKVSFQLKPTVSGLDDIDLSIYENQSSDEVQEVDANSEFEITWTSSCGKSDMNSSDFLSKRNAQGQIWPENTKMESKELSTKEQSTEGKCIGGNESDILLSVEKSKEDEMSSLTNKLESVLQMELCERNSPVDNVCTIHGEDILKENPLFRSDSHEPAMEGAISQEFAEEMSVISEDIVDVSIEELDYSTIVVKKASEYNETLLSSDDSDSDEAEDYTTQDERNEENNVIVDVNRSTALFDKETISIRTETKKDISDEEIEATRGAKTEPGESDCELAVSIKSKDCDNSDQSMSFNKGNLKAQLNNNVNGQNQISATDYLVEHSNEESMAANNNITLQIDFSILQDDVILPPTSDDTINGSFVPKTTGVAYEIPEERQDVNEKSKDLSENLIVSKPSHDSGHEITCQYSSYCLSPTTKRKKKPKPQESDKKKSEFTLPFMDRLRKFKSGSNINSSDSDLQIVSKNRFQSSKVTLHPHVHPHKPHMISTSQDMSLLQRGTSQDIKPDMTSQIQDGKVTASVRSFKNIKQNKYLAVDHSYESFSQQDIQQDKENKAATSDVHSVSNVVDKVCVQKDQTENSLIDV